MKRIILFFVLFCLIGINVFSQIRRSILFSEDEIDIMNLILNDHIEGHNDTEILILKQHFIWEPTLNGFNWLKIIENRFNANRIINDFLNKNSNNYENSFTIIDKDNIFNIINDIHFFIEEDFEKEYENELMELDYYNNKIIRTYFQVSRIGFDVEMNNALLWMVYTKVIRIDSEYYSIKGIGQYIFLTKEDGIWKIERPWFRL